jgi:hypothetical protein
MPPGSTASSSTSGSAADRPALLAVQRVLDSEPNLKRYFVMLPIDLPAGDTETRSSAQSAEWSGVDTAARLPPVMRSRWWCSPPRRKYRHVADDVPPAHRNGRPGRRDQHVGHLLADGGPTGDGCCRAPLRVVGMGHDDQRPLPVLGHRCQGLWHADLLVSHVFVAQRRWRMPDFNVEAVRCL